MLSTKESQELELLTSTIHFQILREHGTIPDAAHRQALKALHQQLAAMVDGEASNWHGRWCLSAPIGFGKSSAVAAFLSAAWQLGFLGNGVTLTITAARVEQLYDFEAAILDAGIPQAEIRKYVSVLHGDQKEERESDENLDAPVLLITQNRIRRVFKRPESGKAKFDVCYFLKYHDEPRDLVLWDERCQLTEGFEIDLSDLKQALSCLSKKVEDAPDAHIPFMNWMDRSIKIIEAEARH
jgi:hypothetical protein